MDADDIVLDDSVGGAAERPARADAIAQTTAFLRERGIDNPEQAATDLVKNLGVYLPGPDVPFPEVIGYDARRGLAERPAKTEEAS